MTITIRRTQTFIDWLTGLTDSTAKARIDTRIARLQLGLMGDVKPIGEGLSELRIAHGPGYRVYFGQRGKQVIVLLAGGDKGSQARDIALAKQIWTDWKRS